jgi:hypothetical protein
MNISGRSLLRVAKCAVIGAAFTSLLSAQTAGDVAVSVQAAQDTELSADPGTTFWRNAKPLLANHDNMGKLIRKDTMTVRSRWTGQNLYILFACPFVEHPLNLKQDPKTEEETFGLWNWDVAEAFIGDDFQNINLYKEFEVSPQAEWVDLDIDRNKLGGSPDAWHWNSGYKVKAKIDEAKNIWYAEMRIPFQAISRKPASPGLEFRINFFRAAGKEPNRLLLTWRPTHGPSFHVPAAFGTFRLVGEK